MLLVVQQLVGLPDYLPSPPKNTRSLKSRVTFDRSVITEEKPVVYRGYIISFSCIKQLALLKDVS